MVCDAEVALEEPPLDWDTDEHPVPSAVTVTVVTAMLVMDTTVVVAHEVTVDARHFEVVSEPVDVPLVVVSRVVVELGVEESDVEDEVLEPLVDVAELVVDDEVDCGTPHSSKLWPFSTVSERNGELEC
jgi:hypothetical protein